MQGCGFLGSHLVKMLLDHGHEVVVLDNNCTSEASGLHLKPKRPGLEIVQGNVTIAFADHLRADRIYHLACPASPIHFATDPVGILDTCYMGTRNALEAARKWKARILIASTSEVYGQPEEHPQKETYHGNVNPFGPRSCYDEGKRVAEALAYGYRQQYGTDVRIARIFNAYGPGMHGSDGRVISSFVSAALAGEPLKINGDGRSTRCFQYVEDCVQGLSMLMESEWQGGPVNIGSEAEISVSDIAELVRHEVAAFTKLPMVNIIHVEALQDDPVRRRPDCALARSVLGWEALVPLAEGIQNTIAWHAEMNGVVLQRLAHVRRHESAGSDSSIAEAI